MKDLTRRELFAGLGKLTAAAGLSAVPAANAEAEQIRAARPLDTPPPFPFWRAPRSSRGKGTWPRRWCRVSTNSS
jgi:hypothetical protein